MSQQTVIAIDLMGGDEHPEYRLNALSQIANQFEHIHFRIFVSNSYLETIKHLPITQFSHFEFIGCERSVSMEDTAYNSLREKRNSSLSQAISDVADQNSQICLTAGNTGSMVAFAKYWLKPMADIEKPVLSVLLPSNKKRALLLDVGATIDASADELLQFSKIGSAWMRAVQGINDPEVALLNVGMESNKGNDTIRQADTLLKSSAINYIGYCEGTHLFSGYADVIVCNGLIGNISLKSCEGIAAHIYQQNKFQKKSIWQKFRKVSQQNETDKYNVALLLGLDGMIVKSHGNCDQDSFKSSLIETIELAQLSLVEKMNEHLEKI